MKNANNSAPLSSALSSQQAGFERLRSGQLGVDREYQSINNTGESIHLYIFNFDGVIADTWHHYRNAVKLAARASGSNIDELELAVLANAPSLDAVGIADVLELPSKVRQRFSTHLDTNLNNSLWRCQCFAGVKQLLNTLCTRGYTAVLSRSNSQMIETILQNNGLQSSVHRIIGSDQIGTPDEKVEQLLLQYSVQAKNTIYCGDSVRDIEFAHRNCMRSAACTWGWQPNLVAECEATFIADRAGQLLTQLLAPSSITPDIAI